jgi:hypothetical protein
MIPRVVVQDNRPADIIMAYWAERLVLEENAVRLDPEYAEVA